MKKVGVWLLIVVAAGAVLFGVMALAFENSLNTLALDHTKVDECTHTPDGLTFKASAHLEYTRPQDSTWGESVIVEVNFLDSEGRIFSTDKVGFNNVGPGQSATAWARTARLPSTDGPISCEIVGGG